MKKKILALVLSMIMAITSVFTSTLISEVFALDADESTDGISISKYVTVTTTEDEDGNITDYDYTLGLEVFTTGVVSETTTTTTPADIVLVLDQSTSMIWPADQAANMTYGDAEDVSTGLNFNDTVDATSISNNVGIIDGSYELNTDGEYEWVQNNSITVSPITVATGTTNWVTADSVVTLSSFANADGEVEWTDYYQANYGYLYSESRQKDVIDAVLEFIYSLDTDAGHRISIVTYHNDAIVEVELTGVSTTTDDFSAVIDEVLSWVTTNNTYSNGSYAGGAADSINTFNLQDSTLIALGVEEAEDILFDAKYTNAAGTTLEDEYIDTGRTQLAVIFTDGIPTQISQTGNTGSSTSTLYNVNRALAASENMKQDGVTVFSIGMLDGVYSEAETATSSAYSDHFGTSGNGPSQTITYYINQGNTFISAFLDLLSSNYVNADEFITDSFPNSSSLYSYTSTNTDFPISNVYNKSTTTVDNEDGSTLTAYTEYYYPIDTSDENTNVADSLSGIFETVAGMMEGNATFDLDQTTQVRDVMTAEYNIPVEFIDTLANASSEEGYNELEDYSGDYDYDEDTDTYYYVGTTGGQYKLDVDISLYIAYCTGANDTSAENYSADDQDDGYYAWDEQILIYDTTNGSTNVINDDVFIVVRNVYIDITRDEDGNYLYGDYVYYYDSVELTNDESGTYYLISNSNYTDGNDVEVEEGDYINHDGNKIGEDEEPVVLYPSQQVIVQGFNFNNYYVTTTDQNGGEEETGDFGAKLIIQFDIEPDTVSIGGDETATGGATIGGNVVETNTTASGVYLYSNDETSGDMGYNSLEVFPVPTADIPLDVELVINDQTIYLGNAVSIVDLVTIDGHTIQGVANQYVDITYTLYAATEVELDDYDAATDGELFTKTEYIPDETTGGLVYDSDGNITNSTITKYYIYTNVGEDYIYSVTIDAGQSATDANGLYSGDSLITPTLDTDYIVEVTVTPVVEGTVEAETYYDMFSVYVLYPEISANDIWVDYATPVNLRDDNIYQIADADGTYTTFDNIRVSWESTSTYDIVIPEPNNAIPPTVTFGFTARRGIEYTAAEFEEYGIREDKEFEITSMTITSSDGYNTVTYFDLDAYEDADTTTFEVNVNRFDLEISKTVEADTYDIYPQSFIFDVSYVGSEFEVIQAHVEDTNGYVVFTYDDPDSNNDDQISVDTSGFYDGETAFAIYSRSGVDITDEFVHQDEETEEWILNTSSADGNNYIVWPDENSFDEDYYIVYDGNAYYSQLLWEDDEETIPVYETVGISDIDKTIEVVIDPDMSTVTTTEWTDSNGTRYYTFTATITELYCGIEMTVTEETDWSWRYEPGFTTSTLASYVDANDDIDLDYAYLEGTATGTSGTDSNGSYTEYSNTYTDVSDTPYTVTNKVYTDGTVNTIITYDNTEVSNTTATMTTNYDDDGITVLSVTKEIREEITGYKMLDFDEVYSGSASLGEYEDVVGTDYDYYLTVFTFDSVSYTTTAANGKSAVILVSNSETYLDKNGSNTDYSSWERLTETVYFGDMHYYAEDVAFDVSADGSGTITYSSTDPDKYDDGTVDLEEPVVLTITTDVEAVASGYHLTGIYYYDDNNEKVYEILTEEDEDGEMILSAATYYVTTATQETDSNGNDVVDAYGNPVYVYTESYAFQVIEIPYAVPAVYFDPIDVELDVYNWLDDDSWLSYSALVENLYDPLDDPRTE